MELTIEASKDQQAFARTLEDDGTYERVRIRRYSGVRGNVIVTAERRDAFTFWELGWTVAPDGVLVSTHDPLPLDYD